MSPFPARFSAASAVLLATASAGAQANDFEALARYSDSRTGHALLVSESGKVLFERYSNGWSATWAHRLASGLDGGANGLVPTCAASISARMLALPATRFQYGPNPSTKHTETSHGPAAEIQRSLPVSTTRDSDSPAA